MSFMETKRISDLNPYCFNVCILVVVSKLTAIKTSKNGNPFFNFAATDASGEIEGVCFEPRLHEKLQVILILYYIRKTFFSVVCGTQPSTVINP